MRGLICLAALIATPAMAQEAFFDDFDSLDQGRWYVSDGWSNGSHQNCTWSAGQITVEGGALRVGFAPVPAGERSNSCGEIQTRSEYGYGTYEARLRTPSGSGLNAAFFTYIGQQQGKPHDEIDFEILLKDTGTVETTTFVNGKSGDGEVGSGQAHALPYPSDSDFVTFAFTWEPDRLRYYINGKLVRTMDDQATIPANPQRIFFSLWGSDTLTDWMGRFSQPADPVAMEVDWVAFTPEGADCAFEQSILCQNEDD
ncbi:endo-1,3-1,4-beta-glycanase ExoK [Devosia lucknowensis]|uniref:Endo-1,3-1,4-beta-glycanase ExoK n=1 Tax=Devosia lucknowensis TaxID=1096929 RepID=A0A1Y6FS17_9HYPH|nr:family 16 glycosylhydrolase [Devosia lucknowensis]SMQ76000.1 endo-1,3-1,4-beta-glycanase ExoK [Devosia lucknowensis]